MIPDGTWTIAAYLLALVLSMSFSSSKNYLSTIFNYEHLTNSAFTLTLLISFIIDIERFGSIISKTKGLPVPSILTSISSLPAACKKTILCAGKITGLIYFAISHSTEVVAASLLAPLSTFQGV